MAKVSQALIRNCSICIGDMIKDQFRLFCFRKRENIFQGVLRKKTAKTVNLP